MTQYSDSIIPLGFRKGIFTLLVNDDGMQHVPPNHVNCGKGGSGYYEIDIPLDVTNITALLLMGISRSDIKKALA